MWFLMLRLKRKIFGTAKENRSMKKKARAQQSIGAESPTNVLQYKKKATVLQDKTSTKDKARQTGIFGLLLVDLN